LHAANISPWYVESSSLIETDLTNPSLALGDGAAMTTGVTAHAVAIKFFVELTFADVLVDDVAKGGHGTPAGLF
jgi:hypothetical protein